MLRFLLGILIVALTVFIAAGRAKNGMHSSAQQTVESAEKKSGLELFASDHDDKLRLVDVKPLSPDRMLVSVNDTIYLLNAKREIIWGTEEIDMVAPPIVDGTGVIYGIRQDVAQFSVDPKSGDASYFGKGVTGTHAYYTQIQPYTGDQRLLVENAQFYRDGNRCYPKCPMASDSLEAWSGEKLLWSTAFPANAELQVWGNKILAVTRQENSVVVQEIDSPKPKTKRR